MISFYILVPGLLSIIALCFFITLFVFLSVCMPLSLYPSLFYGQFVLIFSWHIESIAPVVSHKDVLKAASCKITTFNLFKQKKSLFVSLPFSRSLLARLFFIYLLWFSFVLYKCIIQLRDPNQMCEGKYDCFVKCCSISIVLLNLYLDLLQ